MPKIFNILSTLLVLLILINAAPGLLKSIKEQYKEAIQPKTKVARLKIHDTITDVEFYQQNLEKFFKNKSIKAIVLDIDSPGGAAGSSQALYNEILYLKTEYKKPVLALTYNLCTSAAYNIAIAADYIVATPSALIGSIGNYINQFKINELLSTCHVHYEIEKEGAFKAALNPYVPSTPEQQKMLQQLAHNCYQQFIHDVACQRKLSLQNSTDWANGRVFTGIQALKKGLIDEVGSEFNMVKKLKELALIEKEIEWVKPAYPSIFNQLFGKQDSQPLFALFNQMKTVLWNTIHQTYIG